MLYATGQKSLAFNCFLSSSFHNSLNFLQSIHLTIVVQCNITGHIPLPLTRLPQYNDVLLIQRLSLG